MEHKFWRILVHANGGNTTFKGAIAEVAFLSGGDVVSTGGTPFASETYSAAYAVTKLFDFDPSTYWVSSTGGDFPYSVGYEFAAPTFVDALRIQAADSGEDRAPTEFEVQYSDNGTAWTTTDVGLATSVNWASGEIREFLATDKVILPTNLEASRFQSGVILKADKTFEGTFTIPENTAEFSYSLPPSAEGLIQFYAFDSDEKESVYKTELLDPEMIDSLIFESIYQLSTNATQTAKVSGIVQIDGTPAQRTVRAFGYDPTTHDLDAATVNLSKSLGHSTSDATTGDYTIDLLGGYGQEIFVVAFDDYGEPFTPEATLAASDRIHPTTPNGHVWECVGAGTLPVDEPAWVVDTETSQLYGTASMIARPFYRPMVHGPITPEVVVAEAPESLPTLIGESSNGGFYAGDIQDGGKWYKLIAADIEADVYGLVWMDPRGDWPSAASATDGPGNTLSMAGDTRFAAGNHCLDYRGGGFDDWYMPARDELAAIYQNLGLDKSPPADFQSGAAQAFASAVDSFYWCSTQYSSDDAWYRRFSDGFESFTSKRRTTRRVRPVRRLEFTP
jgi:hypothetical protein